MDLIVEDRSMIGAVYFLMDEANITREMQLPWMSFCSDAASMAPEGVFVKTSAHPRAYGGFARVLGHYVRDNHVITLAEAVRRLTSLPAHDLHLADRGVLAPDHVADVVVFDPATVADHATFEKPHQYSTGFAYVFVNGVAVIDHGEHTNARPGRVVRGPGYGGRPRRVAAAATVALPAGDGRRQGGLGGFAEYSLVKRFGDALDRAPAAPSVRRLELLGVDVAGPAR